ncbi:Receptor-like protein EIX2 [Glycine max]|nr:Receptor-like protein EIX2 [Glycine max]
MIYYHTKKCAQNDKQALLKLKQDFMHGRQFYLRGSVKIVANVIGAKDLNGYPFGNYWIFFNTSTPLRGKLDTSICELQHLTFLDLSVNYLQGEITKCIGSLGQLVEFKLAQNDLVGSVPHVFSNLSNSQNLDFRNTYLVSNDLEWLSHLSNLRYLGLTVVDWPLSISKIPSILKLYLNGCDLRQVTPKSISHMTSSTSLQILSLKTNQLDFNFFMALTLLDIAYNSLQSVPDDFANIISLQYIDLSHFVKVLILSFNKLCGELSDLQELCFAQNLEWLYLDHNPFSSGPLPDISRLSPLNELSLQNTNIVGPFIVQLSNLLVLPLFSNKLNGFIIETHLLSLSGMETWIIYMHHHAFWDPDFQRGSNIKGNLTCCKSLIPVLWICFLNGFWTYLQWSLTKSLPSKKSMNPIWDFSFNNLFGPLPHFPEKLDGLFLSNNMF